MKFIKHEYLSLEEVNLKCWKLLLRDEVAGSIGPGTTPIKDRQLRENRGIAIDTGTEID